MLTAKLPSNNRAVTNKLPPIETAVKPNIGKSIEDLSARDARPEQIIPLDADNFKEF